MRRGRLGAALVAGATGAVGVIGLTACSGPAESPPEPAAAPKPTTLASYDTAGVGVVRGPFCDRVSPTGIEHALGDAPEEHRTWQNGDRVRLPDGTRDRVQEYGCSWTAGDGTRATAWVFAPPITPQRARSLVREATGGGCSTHGGGAFGRPSVATTCTADGATERAHRGLFGDAWLTCTLETTGDGAELGERTSAWCVAVLEAARA
jgi:hypothetical protein